jgi:hypothetical protein
VQDFLNPFAARGRKLEYGSVAVGSALAGRPIKVLLRIERQTGLRVLAVVAFPEVVNDLVLPAPVSGGLQLKGYAVLVWAP